MAAFTINSGGVTSWDSLSGGSTNATLDSYTISAGSTLRIDTDSYQCAGHSTAFGSLDTVSYAGIGGTLLIDPTSVRVVPFNTGASTVPAIGTSITQGAVSGPLLGVWASWQSEPLAAGAAMPTTGFLKIKAVSGGVFSVGALGGISCAATGPDVQGWIEVRGADTAAITVPRIGAFETKQAWFYLEDTDGSAGQIIPCPTTATVAAVWPGVWIETAAGSGVFEQFVGAGSLAALASIPTDARGKTVWQTTGGLRLGSDGTNTVGYLPPTGCKVRIPAVILTCCTRTVAGSGPRVLPNATLATRQEFVTSASGDIALRGAVVHWYANFAQPYRISIQQSAIASLLAIAEAAAPLDIADLIVGLTQAQVYQALTLTSCPAGGLVEDLYAARFSMTGGSSYAALLTRCKGVTFRRNKIVCMTNRTVATHLWQCVQAVDCTWEDLTLIGGRMLHVSSIRPRIVDLHYADVFSGTTGTASAVHAVEANAGCSGLTLDGIDFMGLTNVHPYSGIAGFTGCYDWTLRNIGAPGAPLNFGSANPCGQIVLSSGGNDGIRLQRIYVSNTRLGAWAFTNDDNDVLVENVFPDYSDTSVILVPNCLTRGVGLVGGVTGQLAVYGSHWRDSFRSATTGFIEVMCNEPTAESAAQCSITAGAAQFNSQGQVAMTAVGQQVTWEMPYFALGHTALANLAPTLTGTTTGNLSYEFQADLGAGYGGTWLTLDAANLDAQGAIDPAVGVRLKVRATCVTAATGNLLTNIAIPTVTTSAAQVDNPYPLDSNTATFTGLPTGTDVVVLAAGTSTILAQQDSTVGTTYAYVFSGAQTVDVGFIKAGYVPYYVRGLSLTTVNSSLPVALTPDRNFS